MKIVNLTPHAVAIRQPDGSNYVIAPSGAVARVGAVASVTSTSGLHDGDIVQDGYTIPIYSAPQWGDVVGLPPAEADTIYIVSTLVASRVSRLDVVSPGTGPQDGAIRNDKEQVVAVTRLIRSVPASVTACPIHAARHHG